MGTPVTAAAEDFAMHPFVCTLVNEVNRQGLMSTGLEGPLLPDAKRPPGGRWPGFRTQIPMSTPDSRGKRVYGLAGVLATATFLTLTMPVTVATATESVPTISIDDASVIEGDSGPASLRFVVSLSALSDNQVTVSFATVDDTARAPGDYTAIPVSVLTLQPGQRSLPVIVAVQGDLSVEANETLTIQLSGATGATVADDQGLGTILDDEILVPGGPDWVWRANRELTFYPQLKVPQRYITCHWEFGDGQSTTGGCEFRHTYAAANVYQAKLTIDGTPRDTFKIDILENEGSPPDLPVRGQGQVVSGSDITYTSAGDFDQGTMIRVNHSAPDSDQLQLDASQTLFPFVNVAASRRDTLARIHAHTGVIVGEYLTRPAGRAGSPSQTTVDRWGNTWVANLGEGYYGTQGSVAQIGVVIGGRRVDASGIGTADGQYLAPPFTYNTCIDRNGDGMIMTSRRYGDILPWPNVGDADSAGGVSTAADECIIKYVRVLGSLVGTVAIDSRNDVWVGGWANRVFERLDGATGQRIPGSGGTLGCGGIVGVIDSKDVLWSASVKHAGLLRYPTASGVADAECLPYHANGLALDSQTGHIWFTDRSTPSVRHLRRDGSTVASYPHGSTAPGSGQGLAIDDSGDIWIAHGGNASTVGHIRTDGVRIDNVPLLDGWGPTGAAVDANDRVWIANHSSSSAQRIDSEIGPVGQSGYPSGYVDLTVAMPGAFTGNFSDMTGHTVVSASGPQGFWRIVQDAGRTADWGCVAWESQTQTGVSSIVVEVRASDNLLDLTRLPFDEVANGEDPALSGRYIEVLVSLKSNDTTASPILSSIRIAEATCHLTIDDVTVVEGDSGRTDATFTMTLSAPAAAPVSVEYAVSGGSALVGDDYLGISGATTFAAGDTSRQVSVPVLGDDLHEADETFHVILSAPEGASILDGNAVGTIVNDDESSLTISGVDRLEGDGVTAYDFTVSLAATSSEPVTVLFSTRLGHPNKNPATPGVDYTHLTNRMITIPPGELSAVAHVDVIGDSVDELFETFRVQLSDPTNATIAGDGMARGSIENDDDPTVSVQDVSQAEGNSNVTTFPFVVSLSGISVQPVPVTFATATASVDSATERRDYVPRAVRVTIPAGALSIDVPVSVIGEGILEGDERFRVVLSSPYRATIGDGHAVGTIINDDSLPVSIGPDVRVTEGSPTGTTNLDFVVSLAAPQSETVTVRYTTSPGTTGRPATPGVDYTDVTNGTVEIPAGQTSAIARVLVIRDTDDEFIETLVVTLSDSTNASIVGDGMAIGRIYNDDDPTIRIADVLLAEGDAGTTAFRFAVTLSGVSVQPVTVQYFTSAPAIDPATEAIDYTAVTDGQVTIPAGETSVEAVVVVLGDSEVEVDETFRVVLTRPQAATIRDGEAVGTIRADDAPPVPIVDIRGGQPLAGNNEMLTLIDWSRDRPGTPPPGDLTYELQQRRYPGLCAGFCDIYWDTLTVGSSDRSLFQAFRTGSRMMIEFRVRAVSSSGMTGLWATSRKFGFDRLDDQRLTYTGSWDVVEVAGASDGTVHRTDSDGATAEYQRAGSSVGAVMTAGPGFGRAEICLLDGVPDCQVVDLGAMPAGPAQVVAVWNGLDPAIPHTLRVTRLSGVVELDAVIRIL